MRKEIKSKVGVLFEVFSDPRVRWEYMKYTMRDFSRKFSIEYSTKMSKNKLELENKVKDLTNKLKASSPLRVRSIKEYEECEAELERCMIILPS